MVASGEPGRLRRISRVEAGRPSREGGEARVMFVGAHERQLDDKGRVALPATYRTHLGEHCYLVKGTDKCVEVIPSEAFEHFGRELIAKVDRGELSLNRQRAMASSAVLV